MVGMVQKNPSPFPCKGGVKSDFCGQKESLLHKPEMLFQLFLGEVKVTWVCLQNPQKRVFIPKRVRQ